MHNEDDLDKDSLLFTVYRRSTCSMYSSIFFKKLVMFTLIGFSFFHYQNHYVQSLHIDTNHCTALEQLKHINIIYEPCICFYINGPPHWFYLFFRITVPMGR